MKVGFIGLGIMGGELARLLAAKDFDLSVYDVSADALRSFEGKATLAGCVADVAREAEVIGLCVRDDAQVEECVADLLPAMSPESVLLIHSTVRPSTAVGIGEKAAARSISVLDAPVSRSRYDVEGPFVFTMTGGDESTARRVAPILDAYSTDTLHVGRLGSALALKISNNLVTWTQVMITVEAFRLAEAAGVPAERLEAVMKGNGALTPTMQETIKRRNALRDDPDYRSFVENQCGIGEKDVALGGLLADEAGVAAPTAEHVRQHLRAIFGDFS